MSILLKHATLGNRKLREIENKNLAKKINEDRRSSSWGYWNVPDIDLIFPYVEPTVQTADKIEVNQWVIDEDFIDLQTKFEVNNVVAEQKKPKK